MEAPLLHKFEHQQILRREIHHADKKAGAVGKLEVLRGSQHRQLFPPELKCIIYVVYVIKKNEKKQSIT